MNMSGWVRHFRTGLLKAGRARSIRLYGVGWPVLALPAELFDVYLLRPHRLALIMQAARRRLSAQPQGSHRVTVIPSAVLRCTLELFMFRPLLLTWLCLFSLQVHAFAIYVWKDAAGKIHYSDVAPSNVPSIKALDFGTGQSSTSPGKTPATPANSGKNPSSAPTPVAQGGTSGGGVSKGGGGASSSPSGPSPSQPTNSLSSPPKLSPNLATGSGEMTAQQFASLRLRGFNVDLQSPPLRDADYQAMAATGANLARAFIRVYPSCASCTDYVIAPDNWAYMDRVVAAGQKYKYSVIFTLAPQPGGDKAEYWKNTALQNSIVNLWKQIAQHYKGNTTVAGFDIMNEPVPPTNDGTQAAKMWATLATQLIQAIRQVDPNRMVVVEPAPWADVDALNFLTPLAFSNVVYSIHFYHPYTLTHQGIYGNPTGVPYPSGIWNKAWLSQRLQPARNWEAKYQLPLYVGEFSIARWSPGNSRYNYLNDVISLFEAEKWSWTYLAFRSHPAWDAEYSATLPKSTLSGNWKDRAFYRDENTATMQLLRSEFGQNTH